MGVWQGIYEAHLGIVERKDREKELQQAREDRQRERQEDADRAESQFNRQILESRREMTLRMLQEDRKEQQAIAQQVSAGVAYGLTETTASALLGSNQLSIFLKNAEKSGVDPEYISSLNTVVEAKVGDNPELAAKIMLNGSTQTSANSKDPEKTMNQIVMDIVNATTPEELEEIALGSSRPSIASIPTLPLNLNEDVMRGRTSAETKAYRSEVAMRLSPYFEDSFTTTDTGEVVISQNASPEVNQLFNKAANYGLSLITGAQAQMTPTQAANLVVNKIEEARNILGTAPALEMSQNFEQLMANPSEWANTVRAAPTPTTPTADLTAEEAARLAGSVPEALVNNSGIRQRGPQPGSMVREEEDKDNWDSGVFDGTGTNQ
jgi:hypothetical protein